jgi:hypothetical protein
VPLCCSRAQHNDGKLRTTSDYVSLHPHARAAGTPTGRSPFPGASFPADVLCGTVITTSPLFRGGVILQRVGSEYLNLRPTVGDRVGWIDAERGMNQKWKKGAGASPLFELTPQKPETESRFGSGHPGKPIFLKLPREEQVLCQRAAARSYNSNSMKVGWLAQEKLLFKVCDSPATYKISQNSGGLLRCLGAYRS